MVCVGIADHSAQATEGGASLFLPGLHGPMAGFVPPPGFYFETDFFAYSGRLSATKQTQVGGAVLANVQVDVRAAFLTPTWVTPYKIFGGDLGFAISLPVGVPRVSAGALIAAPRFGRLFNLGLSDATFNIGDPIVTSFIGWHAGNFHWQVGSSVSIPAGAYQPGQLSNLAFNRWVGDFYAAATWLDPTIGLDISGAMGFEINGMNKATQYRSGNAVHFDLSATQHLSKEFALGVLFSHYQQVSGDSGSGASLGPYKGRVTAVGGSAAFSFEVGKTPVTATLKVLREVSVDNRTRGTIGLLSIAFPLPKATPAIAVAQTP
ncbi:MULTISPECIES: transporter [unclassified Beijerinckia]|uniref:SphA family protein n=1 Tax=unclassified Beijerinckia TaxID=2638183 RepID=UPI001FCD3430|nr:MULTISPECIES: transporter [unclassified Beijerinckia]